MLEINKQRVVSSTTKIMEKQKLKDFINELILKIDDELSNHILNVTPIPNPKYMIESNQREVMWSDIDNEIYHTLSMLRDILLNELKK